MRQPSSADRGPWVKCHRREGSGTVKGALLFAVGATAKCPCPQPCRFGFVYWAGHPSATNPPHRPAILSPVSILGGKSLETLPFSTPHSRLHWAQNPFKMRQLKEVPLPVSIPTDSPPAPASTAPRLRVGKLCIAVQGATPAELFAHAEAAIKDSVFMEFRLDFLSKPAAVARAQGSPRPPPRHHRHRHLPPQAALAASSPAPSTPSSKSS